MNQADVDRAVARATGETVSTIKQLGFVLADEAEYLDLEADERLPQVVDWDDLDAERHAANPGRLHHAPAAV